MVAWNQKSKTKLSLFPEKYKKIIKFISYCCSLNGILVTLHFIISAFNTVVVFDCIAS